MSVPHKRPDNKDHTGHPNHEAYHYTNYTPYGMVIDMAACPPPCVKTQYHTNDEIGSYSAYHKHGTPRIIIRIWFIHQNISPITLIYFIEVKRGLSIRNNQTFGEHCIANSYKIKGFET
jgi:hypothetical protein